LAIPVKNIVWLFISFFILFGCDDGDVITVEFEFEDTFNACGDLVFYKTRNDPDQSFSLLLTSPALTLEDLVETEPDAANPDMDLVTLVQSEYVYTLNETTNIFNYRTYSSLPASPFCNDIPPADLNVTQNDISGGGIATITVVLTEDDGDGIPADLDVDINNNNDTDSDGIPNYLDVDDDGDNVLTRTELVDLDPNTDNDDNPLTNPLDTDGDGIPNYLDEDDDGDGVNTIDEEKEPTVDQNPVNDITNPAVGPDYLNALVAEGVPATAYRPHPITQENFCCA